MYEATNRQGEPVNQLVARPTQRGGKALEEAEKITPLLSPALNAGFAVEEVRVTRKPKIKEKGGVKKITVFDYAIGKEWANITATYSRENRWVRNQATKFD